MICHIKYFRYTCHQLFQHKSLFSTSFMGLLSCTSTFWEPKGQITRAIPRTIPSLLLQMEFLTPNGGWLATDIHQVHSTRTLAWNTSKANHCFPSVFWWRRRCRYGCYQWTASVTCVFFQLYWNTWNFSTDTQGTDALSNISDIYSVLLHWTETPPIVKHTPSWLWHRMERDERGNFPTSGSAFSWKTWTTIVMSKYNGCNV